MDMSLDEIIQKKFPGKKPFTKGFINKSRPTTQRKSNDVRVIDARNKIIQKNRAKIRDARDNIMGKNNYVTDARVKLQQRKLGRNMNPVRSKSNNFYRKQLNEIMPPKTIGAPRGYIDYDNMEMMEEEYNAENISLRRTVHNDMLPPYGSFDDRGAAAAAAAMYDRYDRYDLPARTHEEEISLRRQIRNLSPETAPNRMLRSPSPPSYRRERRYPTEASHLSYEMRTRLERAPDPHQSMGIFANPLKQSTSTPSTFRIVVSNLAVGVTQSDIQELFEDIGELHEARLVRPGVAEVIFKNLKDAEKAVDTYHNRQLDGQPMKCLLVNPRSSNKITAPANSSRTSKKTPLEIDIDTLHKVLFRRH